MLLLAPTNFVVPNKRLSSYCVTSESAIPCSGPLYWTRMLGFSCAQPMACDPSVISPENLLKGPCIDRMCLLRHLCSCLTEENSQALSRSVATGISEFIMKKTSCFSVKEIYEKDPRPTTKNTRNHRDHDGLHEDIVIDAASLNKFYEGGHQHVFGAHNS